MSIYLISLCKKAGKKLSTLANGSLIRTKETFIMKNIHHKNSQQTFELYIVKNNLAIKSNHAGYF